ncbi:MAG: alkaline phosphatase family protein [Pseudomonadota bacterium]|nr:alkaline phosphatase family protein [Pseudomonadota bacterium]
MRAPTHGALWLLPLVVACTGPDADKGPHAPSVIVLVLDGVRTDELTATGTSDVTGTSGEAFATHTWDTLAPAGTVVRAIRNTGITITAPAHAALVTGHVETFANFPVDATIGPGLYRPTLPTIFEAARDQLGLEEAQVLLLANTELLEPIDRSLYPGAGAGAETYEVFDPETGHPVGEDAPVIEALLERIDTTAPRLAVVNLHDVDRAGHYGGGDAYQDGVAAVDEQIALFWDEVQAARPAYADSLLLIVTADHGRHRHDDDDGWHNHGDSCTGCREVPLIVIGGGAVAGEILEGTVTALDLVPGIAAHLGITMPWAEGLPNLALFPELEGDTREGDVAIAADGGLTAVQRWLDDAEQRSEVRVDDAIVSTAGVFAAEAPTVLDADGGGRVCFREQALEAVDETWPWVARCLARPSSGGDWQDIGFPDPEVAPFFRAALTERDGVTWAAWPYNPRAAGEPGVGGRIGLSVASWTPSGDGTEGGWSEAVTSPGIFPTDATIVPTDLGLIVAFGASFGDPDSRYTRHVRIVPVSLATGAAVLETEVNLTLEALLGEGARVELPALAADGERARVAMVGITDAGATIAAATSADAGRTWSEAVALPDGGPALPYLAPAWDGPEVVWGTLVDGAAHLCRATPGDTDAVCVDVGSPRLQSFVVADGVATVVRDAGTGAWEAATVTW